MDPEVRSQEPNTPCIMLRIRYPIFGGGYSHYWLCQQCGAAGPWDDLTAQEVVGLGYAVSTRPGLVETTEPPDLGHRFRITVQSAGSYALSTDVRPEPHDFQDADWWGQLRIMEVRAFDLNAALAKAGTLPFRAWVEGDHDEPARH